jgi:hypothetical protein
MDSGDDLQVQALAVSVNWNDTYTAKNNTDNILETIMRNASELYLENMKGRDYLWTWVV